MNHTGHGESGRGAGARNFLRSLLSIAAACVVSCAGAKNYLDPEGPRYTGRYGVSPTALPKAIKVVTYNIQFAEKIDLAIEELREFPELRGTDIVLLQEMDAAGTERIAETFHFYYVYYPASMRSEHRQMGNAILSKWPILETSKLLLPHEKPFSKQRRIAVSAEIAIGDDTLTAYSAHTETVWLRSAKRLDQARRIVEDISGRRPAARVIVGGDFNTWRKRNIDALGTVFASAGLVRATEGAGPTCRLSRTLDHIYVRGYRVIASGTVGRTEASDHHPVWVILERTER